MKNILRIGMLLCTFLLASVGWVMAQTAEGGGSTIYVNAESGNDDAEGAGSSEKPF